MYNFYGFGLLSNWAWQTTSVANLYQSPATTYGCNFETFVGLARYQYIEATYSNLKTHFAVRVLFVHYYFAQSGSQNIGIYMDGTTNNVPFNVDLTGSNNPGYSCGPATKAIRTMVDESYAHTAAGLTLRVSTSGSAWWGIK